MAGRSLTRARRPTMDDVAREAGVSKATVSRVLAGIEDSCTPETAQRVRDCAAELGYVLNSVAASLRSQQSFTVGLILADVSNPFFGAVASGIEQRLFETGYSVVFGNSNNSLATETALVKLLAERRIDGLIAAPSGATGKHLAAAAKSGIKVVLVDSDLPGAGFDCVTIDNRQAARKAISHLIELGHRRIAIVTGPCEAIFDRERFEGYREALQGAGIPFDDRYVLKADLTAAGGEQALERLLTLDPRPTGLFVSNNMMTLGVLTALGRTKLRVPKDLALIGFDDQPWYGVFNPPLTAVSNPAFELGQVAADRLLAAMSGANARPAQRVLLNCDLVVRQSTAPPGTKRRAA